MLATVLAMFVQTACSDDDDENAVTQGTTVFEVSPVTFGSSELGKETEIRFQAGNSWNATSLTASWLSISPTSGNAGEATIKVRLLENNNGATVRSRDLSIQVAGEATPYVVRITQNPSEENDLRIHGDVNEGAMTLTTDETGNNFTGKITITSSKKWTVTAEGNSSQWLSFAKDGEPMDGKETTVTLTVFGSYNKFTDNVMTGAFLIQTENSSQTVRIEVSAQIRCNVYEKERAAENEKERTEYELVDTITRGTYQTTFYVESDIRWELKNVPKWIQLASEEGATNLRADGSLNPMRVGVGLLLNPDYISTTPKEADVYLTNVKGEILKTIHLTFAGTGNDYLQYDFEFPASDPFGNEFMLEARADYIDPDNSDDYWKKIELPFHVTTSQDYTSLDDAPYHLLMCMGNNGNIMRQEVHWASLHMGDASQNTGNNGLYNKEIYLRAGDRPDTDDRNGITSITETREAFIFIVHKDVAFDDLFEGSTSSLKKEYEEAFSHILQKQDHNANYHIAFEGLKDKDVLTIPAEGCSDQYNITSTNVTKMGYDLKRLFKPAGSDEWTEQLPSTSQSNTIYIDFGSNMQSITLNVGANTTGVERRFRFYLHAFRGDGYDDINIFQFDIIQPAK